MTKFKDGVAYRIDRNGNVKQVDAEKESTADAPAKKAKAVEAKPVSAE